MAGSRPSPFHVHVGPEGALVLHGELDMATVQQLQDMLDEVMVPGQPIVFDLAQLTFLDSSGIHCIIRTCSATGHPVLLKNASPAVRRTLEIMDSQPEHSRAWVFAD